MNLNLSRRYLQRLLLLCLIFIPAFGICQIPTNGLVAWYPFDGNPDDQSGSGYTGTPSGAVPSTDRFGAVNNAYYFDGQDDVLGFGDILDSVMIGAGAQFSMSFWLNQDFGTNQPGASRVLLSKYAHSSCGQSEKQFRISLDGPDVGVYYGDDGTSWDFRIVATADGGLAIPATWHHVVLNYDGTQSGNNGADRIEFYVDSIVRAVSVVNQSGVVPPQLNDAATSLGLGGYLTPSNTNCGLGNFSGSIDDVRVYDRLLTANEVVELFNESPMMSRETSLEQQIEIFPQPIESGEFQVRLPGEWAGADLTVYDLTGAKIVTQSVSAGTQTIHLDATPPGIYILILQSKEQVVRKKIFIQ